MKSEESSSPSESKAARDSRSLACWLLASILGLLYVQSYLVTPALQKYWGRHQFIMQAQSTAQLGHTALQAGQCAAAEVLLRHALDMQQRHLGVNHTLTLGTMGNLGNALTQLHQYPEAQQLLAKVMQARQRALGPADPLTIASMSDMAASLCSAQQGKEQYTQAAKLYHTVVELRTVLLGAEHNDTVSSQESFGRCCLTACRQGAPLWGDVCPAALRPQVHMTRSEYRALQRGDMWPQTLDIPCTEYHLY